MANNQESAFESQSWKTYAGMVLGCVLLASLGYQIRKRLGVCSSSFGSHLENSMEKQEEDDWEHIQSWAMKDLNGVPIEPPKLPKLETLDMIVGDAGQQRTIALRSLPVEQDSFNEHLSDTFGIVASANKNLVGQQVVLSCGSQENREITYTNEIAAEATSRFGEAYVMGQNIKYWLSREGLEGIEVLMVGNVLTQQGETKNVDLIIIWGENEVKKSHMDGVRRLVSEQIQTNQNGSIYNIYGGKRDPQSSLIRKGPSIGHVN